MPFSGVHIVWFILYVVLPISSGPASRIGIFWDGEYFNNLQTTNSFWHSTKRLASFLSNWMVFRFVHHMCLRIWIPKRPVVTSSVLWSVLFPGQLKSLTSFPPFQRCGKNLIIFLPCIFLSDLLASGMQDRDDTNMTQSLNFDSGSFKNMFVISPASIWQAWILLHAHLGWWLYIGRFLWHCSAVERIRLDEDIGAGTLMRPGVQCAGFGVLSRFNICNCFITCTCIFVVEYIDTNICSQFS